MIDPFDYKEPPCATCGGKEFYSPEKDAPKGRIPVKRVIDKVDEAFNSNDLAEAGRLLEFWQKEALSLEDKSGELSVTDELIGYYRKTGEAEKGLAAVSRALELLKELSLEKTVSGATIILNAATTMKAFGKAEKALPLYNAAEETLENLLDKEDVLLAGLYNNKALALADANNAKEAENYYKKAISVMEKAENGRLDEAVSYVNLAVLYSRQGEEKSKITDCMFRAYELLTDERNEKNGYYAFVLSKCAPAFGEFGYDKIERELAKESEEIYARNRHSRKAV